MAATTGNISNDSLEKIVTEVVDCSLCKLSSSRKNAVPGDGQTRAKIFFVGEAPGKNEDEKGKPFVGFAGRILDEALQKAGIARSQVFITNIVKCRPPGNRKPEYDERAACRSYLDRQVSLIAPRIICILGATAYSSLLGGKSITQNRGKIIKRKGQKYFITIHPAAAIYNKDLKHVLEEDLSSLSDEIKKMENPDRNTIFNQNLSECNTLQLYVCITTIDIIMIKADKMELNQLEDGINQDILDRKIDFATAGVHSYIHRDLTENVSPRNALTVAEYILEMKTENNLSDNSRAATIELLSILSKFHNNKSFLLITRDDIIDYLDSLRKPDVSDPLHKWIGSYNIRRTMLLRFFKRLHYPGDTPKARTIPAVVQNLPLLKRKEQSIYKPADLWTVEDDLLFSKYCPNKRDIGYHAISRDTSCRPHEILDLRIKDVVFNTVGNHQYAEILVNGKTGSRSIPLLFVKDWLDEHFQREKTQALLNTEQR